MRARRLLAPSDMRGLPRGLSPLALHRLAPTMRRISSDAGPTATTAGTTANARGTPGCAGTATAERRAAQRAAWQRQLHRASTVHRDVQRRGPRVPHLPRLPLSARQVYRERQLWRRIYRQRGWGRAGRRRAGRRAGSVGERVLQ